MQPPDTFQLAGRRRLLLVGSFGAGNTGDELILAGALKKLRVLAPRAELCVLTGQPARVSALHGVSAEPLVPVGLRSCWQHATWRRSLAALRWADVVLLPGGGLLTDQESSAAVLLWAGQILAARAVWRPVFAFGQSIGPLRSSLARALAARALRSCQLIGCRDAASQQLLEQLGVSVERIAGGQDSALFLQEPVRRRRGSPQAVLLVPRIGALTLSNYRQVCAALLTAGVTVTVTAFDRRDEPLVAKLTRVLQIPRMHLPEQPQRALAAVQPFDVVASSRLHGLVTGYLTGSRLLALAGSDKLTGFVEQVGGLCLQAADVTAERIAALFDATRSR